MTSSLSSEPNYTFKKNDTKTTNLRLVFSSTAISLLLVAATFTATAVIFNHLPAAQAQEQTAETPNMIITRDLQTIGTFASDISRLSSQASEGSSTLAPDQLSNITLQVDVRAQGIGSLTHEIMLVSDLQQAMGGRNTTTTAEANMTNATTTNTTTATTKMTSPSNATAPTSQTPSNATTTVPTNATTTATTSSIAQSKITMDFDQISSYANQIKSLSNQASLSISSSLTQLSNNTLQIDSKAKTIEALAHDIAVVSVLQHLMGK